ncbi:helix-turn-helix transcriptional regulator [Candidatus Poriferisodalis sp.]|uniref:helix-turn-helix transcriptional regulator n=1 Tax=Candidatus Poriferisodalis sp. TaxID=3101277 RepID=UPI003B01B19A
MEHAQPEPQAPLLLSRPEVERLTGLSTSSLYRAMRSSDFPEPLRIGKRAVRWRYDEIRAWIEERPRASGIVGKAA